MKLLTALMILALIMPLAHSFSIKDIIGRYIFSASAPQFNITGYTDLMADKDNDGLNDTLVFELETSSAAGNFIFVINVLDKEGAITNETNITLSSGTGKINITVSSGLLSQNKFNYSIKAYNSSRSLKYRKDGIETQEYKKYEEGFKVISISDSKAGKSLSISVMVNSSINGTFESMLFLGYNNSAVSAKANASFTGPSQNISFYFQNETIKRTHYAGRFNISSVKIGIKTAKPDYATKFYDFRDFASESYIFNFTDKGIDADGNGKHESVEISTGVQITSSGNYTIVLAMHDLFNRIVEKRNLSLLLSSGKSVMPVEFNGTRISSRKLNGPFAVKLAELYRDGELLDRITDAHVTGNYNYNDFESRALPDIFINVSYSDAHRYGIPEITINFTFRNRGNRQALNVPFDIFDNRTFAKSNRSSMIKSNSEITYTVSFTNISDFEISAIADLQNLVEEVNESNNAQKITIKLNKKPGLSSISNLTVNETDKIILNITASDQNNDSLSYSINLSKFSNKSNIFEWATATTDSGNYTLRALASDGFLNDSVLFRIIVLDAPEKDSDNDGVNDSVDRLIGDKDSINTTSINVSVFLDDSSNLSRLINESAKVRIMDVNLTIVEFELDFSLHKLNLTNVTLDKQQGNSTGSLIAKGLNMPAGITKTLYMDKVNSTINGICVKDEEINSIDDISSSCSSVSEFRVECDGTMQNSYKCIYNSTSGKYQISGLKHSGIIQISYSKSETSSGSASGSVQNSGSSGGGGGGVTCVSDWKCGDWSECISGSKTRLCSDLGKCAFPSKKPEESQDCRANELKDEIGKKDIGGYTALPDSKGKENEKYSGLPPSLLSVTGQAAMSGMRTMSFESVFDIFSAVLAIAGIYLGGKSIFQ